MSDEEKGKVIQFPDPAWRGKADMTEAHIASALALARKFSRYATGKRADVVFLALAHMIAWLDGHHPDNPDVTLATVVKLVDALLAEREEAWDR